MGRLVDAIPKLLSESDLLAARELFQRHESRDLFYRAARELARLSMARKTDLTVGEALGTLLKTWNTSFYRFHSQFDEAHIQALDNLIRDNQRQLRRLSRRSITSLNAKEQPRIAEMFSSFETLLGPVGAAKALHLLAPRFFPLWDRAIASHYSLSMKRRGENASTYIEFMKVTKRQVGTLELQTINEEDVLKMIDEYNYSNITKHWT